MAFQSSHFRALDLCLLLGMTTVDLFKLVSLSITRHDDHRDVLQVALHGDAGVVTLAWSLGALSGTPGKWQGRLRRGSRTGYLCRANFHRRTGQEKKTTRTSGTARRRRGWAGGRLQATAPFGTEEGSVGTVHGSLFHELRSSRCINSIRDQSNQLTSASSIPHVNLNSDNTT